MKRASINVFTIGAKTFKAMVKGKAKAKSKPKAQKQPNISTKPIDGIGNGKVVRSLVIKGDIVRPF